MRRIVWWGVAAVLAFACAAWVMDWRLRQLAASGAVMPWDQPYQ